MTTVVICSGGPEQELCSLESFASREDVVFIGVDRGAYYLLQRGILPIAIVGDFDSLTAQEWSIISKANAVIERFQPEKDETDTDLALLKGLTFTPSEIILTGVTGGRLDHYEAAVRSLFQFTLAYPNVKIKIVNASNEIQFLTAGEHQLERHETYPYISFFAYASEVFGVTLRGVKYETTDETISFGTTRFTSNEIVDELGSISFGSGICLMIRSVD